MFEGNGWSRNLRKTRDNNISRYIFDYYVTFEPLFTLQETALDISCGKRIKNGIQRRLDNVGRKFGILHPMLRDYDMEWAHILDRQLTDKKMLAGGFVNWDNTPRKRDGLAYVNATPEKFQDYLTRLIKKVELSNLNNIIFLTAWNEWGRSYLEPDERNGFAYLNAVKAAVGSRGASK